MNIFFKNIFLLIVLVFTKNTFLNANMESRVYEGNKEIVNNTVKEIIVLKLDVALYEALLNDIEMLYNQIYAIIDQIIKKKSNLVDEENNLDEMIFNYRSSAISFNKFSKINLLSQETQVSLMTSFLFGIGAILTQKTKMAKILNDEQIGGVLFLMTAMGVEFSCLDVIEKIIGVIHKSCAHLKTNELDNYIYEATIYEVFNIISEKIIDKGLCNDVIAKIVSNILLKMKDNIIVLRNESSKKIKKTKNKK